jgi:hypothetical protein
MKTEFELKLPNVFPYTVFGNADEVGLWVDHLLDVDAGNVTRLDPVLAVTVDFDTDIVNGPQAATVQPVWRLWLSDTSYARLRATFGDAVERNVDRRNLTESTRTRTHGSGRLIW